MTTVEGASICRTAIRPNLVDLSAGPSDTLVGHFDQHACIDHLVDGSVQRRKPLLVSCQGSLQIPRQLCSRPGKAARNLGQDLLGQRMARRET